jgi:CheY-like chemotaxis protein
MSDPVVVLLVEDEPLVRILLSELLTENGFRVVEAANAQEALTIFGAELDVRVMLTDVDMPPGLNGYELARHVHERWPGVGILVTSGRRWPTNGDLPQGAAFLAKPMPNEVLVSYVKAAVERSTGAAEDTAVEVERTVVPFPKRAKTLWPSSE